MGLPAGTGPGNCFRQLVMAEKSDLLVRTEPPRRANGERKLAHNVFMQVTWGLLGLAAAGQLFLLVWLDVMS